MGPVRRIHYLVALLVLLNGVAAAVGLSLARDRPLPERPPVARASAPASVLAPPPAGPEEGPGALEETGLKPPPEDPAVTRAASLPPYVLAWGLRQLLAGSVPSRRALTPEQVAMMLSILRQGPVQLETGLVGRFEQGMAVLPTAVQRDYLRHRLPRPRIAAASEFVGSVQPGPLLGAAIRETARRAGEDWRTVTYPPVVGAHLKLLGPSHRLLALLLKDLLALAEAPTPAALTPAQARAILPGLVSLLEAADGARPHARAMARLLRADQARGLLVAVRGPRSTAALDPDCFLAQSELFTAMARRDRLLNGEPATSEAQGPSRLAVAYNDLLWGVRELARRPHGLQPEQARHIAAIVESVVFWAREKEPVYVAAVQAVRTILRPDQFAYVETHLMPPEAFARRLGPTPMGADVIGFALLERLRATAGLQPFALRPPRPAKGHLPPGVNPGGYFAGILMAYEVPGLAPDQTQARALLPYVLDAVRTNDVNHLIKEQISDILRPEQRAAILQALQRRGPARTMVTTVEVLHALRRRFAGGKSGLRAARREPTPHFLQARPEVPWFQGR